MMRRAGAEVLQGADCAVPVPLHPWRRVRRGFNQADCLARGLGIPVVQALWRTKLTTPQSLLRGAARRNNVVNAFVISPLMWPAATRRRWLDGTCVVLVDDVWTTGATLSACARVLRAGGVREVRALTLARASLPAATLRP
jgi:ComF family protein